MGRSILRAAVGALVLAGPVGAQSVRPIIAEYERPTTASFEVHNPTLFPVTVVVEPWAFDLDRQGHGRFFPLPPAVDVRLSETSFQVGPRATHTVFYEIRAERMPVWFTIYATIVGPRPETVEGLRLRLRLPHTVYVYGDPLREEDVGLTEVRHDREAGAVVALVRNLGERLGRVRWAEASGGGEEAESPGFPLLPGGVREVRVPWTADEPPTELTLHTDGFRVRVPVPAGGREVRGEVPAAASEDGRR